MIELNKIYNEDCIGENGMCLIPDKSINMILCDLPYGVTAKNKWDIIIPFEKLWEQYLRIIKDDSAIVLFSQQPFTTDLINSNRKLFRYSLIWNKERTSGSLNANRMPLRSHEDILLFYKKLPNYNPQMTKGEMMSKGGGGGKSSNYGDAKEIRYTNDLYYPRSILNFKACHNMTGKIHPTQKPVELLEYLINTYSNEGEIILDNCMGSGSTAIACINTNRHYIGFENGKNDKTNEYWSDIANKRIKEHRLSLIDC